VLIIVDQSMPEISGLEFITKVRARGNATTPIVMITGHSEKELQREALKLGASAFLGKPVDPVAFVSLARNLIQLRGARIDVDGQSRRRARRLSRRSPKRCSRKSVRRSKRS
jgi:FixJ family two-component response regulator